ncbi:hypothetical protein BC826DRAFT_1177006 [Russula brevipes]|nr:hypothetical protein BC826DRAFT_1177006 [Russula brevipes]
MSPQWSSGLVLQVLYCLKVASWRGGVRCRLECFFDDAVRRIYVFLGREMKIDENGPRVSWGWGWSTPFQSHTIAGDAIHLKGVTVPTSPSQSGPSRPPARRRAFGTVLVPAPRARADNERKRVKRRAKGTRRHGHSMCNARPSVRIQVFAYDPKNALRARRRGQRFRSQYRVSVSALKSPSLR